MFPFGRYLSTTVLIMFEVGVVRMETAMMNPKWWKDSSKGDREIEFTDISKSKILSK